MSPPVPAEVGIVLVTHGSYGAALLEAARGIGLALSGAHPIAIEPGDRQPDVARKVDEAVHHADRGAGVIVCGDLCGSTPGNACVSVARAAQAHGEKVAVVFGLSLAMLTKLAAVDRAAMTPAQLADCCAETARKSVRIEDPR